MVAFRFLLGPTIFWLAARAWSGFLLAACVSFGTCSDILDGILARHWQVETRQLRIADSLADTVLYLGATAALWLRYPAVVRANRFLLITLIGLEVTRYLFDAVKFGRTASYHSFLAKGWGLLLATTFIVLLGFGAGKWLVTVSLVVGIACDTEGLCMSLLLPTWHYNVRTVWHAIRLRQKADTLKAARAKVGS